MLCNTATSRCTRWRPISVPAEGRPLRWALGPYHEEFLCLTVPPNKDAYILGRLLADARTTLAHVSEVFKIYEDIRLPFSQNVVKNAGKVGLMYEFNFPELYDGQPSSAESDDTTESLKELGEAIQEMWKWQWEENVEEQWEIAQTRFEQLLEMMHA